MNPHKTTRVKQMPYESGMDPIGDARQRFDVRFYLVAIVFLLFDVELLFLYPWAVAQWSWSRALAPPGRACRSPESPRNSAGWSSGRSWSSSSSWPRRSLMPGGKGSSNGGRQGPDGRPRESRAARRVALTVKPAGALEMPENMFVTTLDSVVNWCRKYSLWPMPFATACCGIELMAVGASRFDIARFGAEVMRFSPRQCDLMIVAGRVAMKMMPVLQRIWLQMPEPKWCISMGACASTGGIFDTYAVVQGVDRFIPVDVYIPGCPPRPEQILRALMDIQAKIQKGGTRIGSQRPARVARAREVPGREAAGPARLRHGRRARRRGPIRLPPPRRPGATGGRRDTLSSGQWSWLVNAPNQPDHRQEPADGDLEAVPYH